MAWTLNHAETKAILSYDDTTGIFHWLVSPLPNIAAGSVAGIRSGSRLRILYQGHSVSAHRLAWFYVTGQIPGHVGHLNENPFDNRLINLEPKAVCLAPADLLVYDPTSRSGLRWKIDRGYAGHGARAGDEAGTLNTDRRNGYRAWMVKLGHGKRGAHRIVWEICTGKPIPAGLEIDHIDGDSTNNRIENLRVVTRSGNCRNLKLRKTNRVGVPGVYFSAHAKGDGAYSALYIDHSGKEHTRTFACRKHGADRARQLAIEWRQEKIRIMNAQGAGYTARHIGTPMESTA